jgi:hypothetical protein
MRSWFGRVRRMRGSDYGIALEIVALAVWVEIALRFMPFSRLLEPLTHRSPHTTGSIDEYRRLHGYVAVAYDVLPFPATCLRRSVVLYGLLARRGVPSRVCFGVAKSGIALDAHAWVECDGITRDSGSLRFSELVPPAEELPHVVNEQLRRVGQQVVLNECSEVMGSTRSNGG